MIVWGGALTQSLGYNTGGRYDPELNQWTSTTTTGAPTGRTEHTGVWTGNELIVWGGWDNATTYYNTGAEYTFPNDGALCEDGDICTGPDSCLAGSCSPGPPVSCNDSNPCTLDVCDSVGGCTNTPTSPPPITGLVANDPSQFTWEIPPGEDSVTVDVLRGQVGQWPVGSGVGEMCLAPNTDDNSVVDNDPVANGVPFYYLIRLDQGACTGPYGTTGEGDPRESTNCP